MQKGAGSRLLLLRTGAEGNSQTALPVQPPFSFPKENGRHTSKKAFRLAVSVNDLCASGMRLPARGVAACACRHDFASALSSAPLCPSWQYNLISVHRGTPHSASALIPAFGGDLPPCYRLAPHDSKALQLKIVRNAGGSGEAMYTCLLIAATRAALQDKNCQCAGSRGKTPCLSLGVPKGVFSLEREYPLCSRRPQAAYPRAPGGAKTHPLWACKGEKSHV